MNTQPAAPAAAVTRIASRRARAGQEATYEALVREMFEQMRQTPGFRHGQLVPPEQAGGLCHVISQFDSEAALQARNASPKRADIHARMRAVAEDEPEYRVLTGLEAWFAPAVVPATMHPPRSRMAFVTWLGIFPTAAFFLWFVAPLVAHWPFLLRTALITGLIVATMTWLVAPRLTRWMRGFLNPKR